MRTALGRTKARLGLCGCAWWCTRKKWTCLDACDRHLGRALSLDLFSAQLSLVTHEPGQDAAAAIHHECPHGCCLSLDYVLANRAYDLEMRGPSWWHPLKRAYYRGFRDCARDVIDDAGK